MCHTLGVIGIHRRRAMSNHIIDGLHYVYMRRLHMSIIIHPVHTLSYNHNINTVTMSISVYTSHDHSAVRELG